MGLSLLGRVLIATVGLAPGVTISETNACSDLAAVTESNRSRETRTGQFVEIIT
jgi:hypothetical protein